MLQSPEMVAVAWAAIGLLAATLVSSLFYLGSRIDALGARIDNLDSRLGSRIDGLEASLNGRLDSLDTRLSSRIDGLSARMDAIFPRPRGLRGTDD